MPKYVMTWEEAVRYRVIVEAANPTEAEKIVWYNHDEDVAARTHKVAVNIVKTDTIRVKPYEED